MLITHNFDWDIQGTVEWCNKLGLSGFVFSIHPVSGQGCTVIFKAMSREDQRYVYDKLVYA